LDEIAEAVGVDESRQRLGITPGFTPSTTPSRSTRAVPQHTVFAAPSDCFTDAQSRPSAPFRSTMGPPSGPTIAPPSAPSAPPEMRPLPVRTPTLAGTVVGTSVSSEAPASPEGVEADSEAGAPDANASPWQPFSPGTRATSEASVASVVERIATLGCSRGAPRGPSETASKRIEATLPVRASSRRSTRSSKVKFPIDTSPSVATRT
jgi:hypothetical protein